MEGNGKTFFRKFGLNPYIHVGTLIWESPNGLIIGKLILDRGKKTIFLMPREGSGYENKHLKPGQGDLPT